MWEEGAEEACVQRWGGESDTEAGQHACSGGVCSGGVCRGPAAGTQVLGCSGIMGKPEQSDQTTARRGWHNSKVQKTSDGCPQRRPHTWASGKHGGGRRQP